MILSNSDIFTSMGLPEKISSLHDFQRIIEFMDESTLYEDERFTQLIGLPAADKRCVEDQSGLTSESELKLLYDNSQVRCILEEPDTNIYIKKSSQHEMGASNDQLEFIPTPSIQFCL